MGSGSTRKGEQMATMNRIGALRKNRVWPVRRQAQEKTQAPGLDSQAVAQVAYELYVQRGRIDGHDLEDWLRAEAIVKQRQSAGAAPTRT